MTEKERWFEIFKAVVASGMTIGAAKKTDHLLADYKEKWGEKEETDENNQTES